MSVLLDEETAAVDHFAGVGWGVACHRLGIREYGVDNAKHLIVGNAVPPLLAEAVLSALLAPAGVRDAWDQVFAEVAG